MKHKYTTNPHNFKLQQRLLQLATSKQIQPLLDAHFNDLLARVPSKFIEDTSITMDLNTIYNHLECYLAINFVKTQATDEWLHDWITQQPETVMAYADFSFVWDKLITLSTGSCLHLYCYIDVRTTEEDRQLMHLLNKVHIQQSSATTKSIICTV